MFDVSTCIKTFVQGGLGAVYVVAGAYIALRAAEWVARETAEWIRKRQKGGQKNGLE